MRIIFILNNRSESKKSVLMSLSYTNMLKEWWSHRFILCS